MFDIETVFSCNEQMYVLSVDETRAPSTVAASRNAILTRVSFDCGRLQIGDVTREVEFLSNDYTNPKTFTMLALTL